MSIGRVENRVSNMKTAAPVPRRIAERLDDFTKLLRRGEMAVAGSSCGHHVRELTSGAAEDLNARPSADSTRSALADDQA